MKERFKKCNYFGISLRKSLFIVVWKKSFFELWWHFDKVWHMTNFLEVKLLFDVKGMERSQNTFLKYIISCDLKREFLRIWMTLWQNLLYNKLPWSELLFTTNWKGSFFEFRWHYDKNCYLIIFLIAKITF